MGEIEFGKLGWRPDLPDFRDLSPDSEKIAEILSKSKPLKSPKKAYKKYVDLRKWCSPVEDQGDLGSCTANAGVGLMEYYQKRAYGTYLDASRLFLYKATRNLLGWTGDTGAYLRTTMKAMVLFGIPEEKYWPYKVEVFDMEPPPFDYAFAQNYQSTLYYRLDPPNVHPDEVLKTVKSFLAAELPCMFGFSVYSSMPRKGDATGDIPFPDPGDSLLGGHAVVAVGYDDDRTIGKNKGALLIRNSWGKSWGENGYGWLPYAYVESGLAIDFWSLVQAKFIDTNLFQ